MTPSDWVLYRAADEIASTIMPADFHGGMIVENDDGTATTYKRGGSEHAIPIVVWRSAMRSTVCDGLHAMEVAALAVAIYDERRKLWGKDEQ